MENPGFRVALVGASSLKGKELKQALEQGSMPAHEVRLLDDDELLGLLTEFQGQPAFIRSIERESFENLDFAFFTAAREFTQKYWRLADPGRVRIIDLTDALEDEPGAVVAGPLATGELPPGDPRIFIAAHPAALVIAAVLRRLSEHFAVARAIVNVFEPASERGSAGVEELHQQTVGLLSFHEIPHKVFGSQLAFNLLPAGGEEARPTLVEVEARVGRHLEKLLGGRTARPSIRVVQSPTFHAHSFSFYIELEQPRAIEDLERALAGPGFDVRTGSQEAPNAIGAAASEEDMVIGDIRADSASPRGYWLWAAADNLRLLARNAVRIAEQSARVRP